MPWYQGQEVEVKPLPEDDPRHAGNPNELVVVSNINGAPETVLLASEISDKPPEPPVPPGDTSATTTTKKK